MAHNLLRLGHTVTVYNRTPGKVKALTDLGAKEVTSVADAVKNSEVVITMLSDDAAVKEMVHGPMGLLQNLAPEGIHLCMGTIEVETSAALALAHAQVGQGYVAAPILGRVDAVESGHIWIVAGGPEPQVNRCRPIFEAVGRGYTRVGPNAALAHALKLSGNLLSMAMELAVSEILIYAKKSGLPPADFLRLLNTAVFRSHMVHDYGAVKSRPSFDPEDKTLDLAANEMLLQAAKDLGVAIPVADMLNARLQAAGARGWGEQDLAELAQVCRVETGGETSPVHVSVPAPTTAHAPVPTPTPTPIPTLVSVPIPIPESQTQPPNPSVSRSSRRSPRESKKAADMKGTKPQEVQKPQPIPPPVNDKAYTSLSSDKVFKPAAPASASQMLPPSTFTAMEGGIQVMLDLNQTSHFEVIKGHVWAWTQGRRYDTPWRNLEEVELTFKHTLFLPIKRHLLLRPEAVIDLRFTFGGWAKARVGSDLELDVSRAAATRLKELLGL
jgi:3-hydroxyisobutyrate dehydrogenase-like beta-hydroxyacid dehydrogenase